MSRRANIQPTRLTRRHTQHVELWAKLSTTEGCITAFQWRDSLGFNEGNPSFLLNKQVGPVKETCTSPFLKLSLQSLGPTRMSQTSWPASISLIFQLLPTLLSCMFSRRNTRSCCGWCGPLWKSRQMSEMIHSQQWCGINGKESRQSGRVELLWQFQHLLLSKWNIKEYGEYSDCLLLWKVGLNRELPIKNQYPQI